MCTSNNSGVSYATVGDEAECATTALEDDSFCDRLADKDGLVKNLSRSQKAALKEVLKVSLVDCHML